MSYLNKDAVKKAKMCVANIKDKLQAIETELLTREKPYKSYINEKLSSITWDVNVLNSMMVGDDKDDN